jgi:hypothetical protein
MLASTSTTSVPDLEQKFKAFRDHTDQEEIKCASAIVGPRRAKTKPTWFKLYPLDILCDGKIESMDFDEFGLHCYLLMRSWLDDGIPASLGELRRYTLLRCISRTKLERMWRAVSPFWTPVGTGPDSRLVNPRQERERQSMEKFWKAKLRASRTQAEKRKKWR